MKDKRKKQALWPCLLPLAVLVATLILYILSYLGILLPGRAPEPAAFWLAFLVLFIYLTGRMCYLRRPRAEDDDDCP